ncbi:DUF7331 family protein [Natrinema halophilum]|uniref:Uncharacterized protein n=1 Tax=Natrinema halophilum TaxID=1699371 RepID=A0A7D5L044_9EURY|nr:hypothetical protein [Natrinema halophilum]QLG50860.1 hypothetical protein HYG82_19475 [Natrinema halophilum]
MQTNGKQRDEQVVTADFDIDQYVSYADGDGTIVTDRRNPSAWIRSTDVRPCIR